MSAVPVHFRRYVAGPYVTTACGQLRRLRYDSCPVVTEVAGTTCVECLKCIAAAMLLGGYTR